MRANVHECVNMRDNASNCAQTPIGAAESAARVSLCAFRLHTFDSSLVFTFFTLVTFGNCFLLVMLHDIRGGCANLLPELECSLLLLGKFGIDAVKLRLHFRVLHVRELLNVQGITLLDQPYSHHAVLVGTASEDLTLTPVPTWNAMPFAQGIFACVVEFAQLYF